MQTRDYRSIIEDIESRIGSARLMAVSKTRSIEEIMDVYDAGCHLFGENHVQEIVAKFRTKPADLELHMIGDEPFRCANQRYRQAKPTV